MQLHPNWGATALALPRWRPVVLLSPLHHWVFFRVATAVPLPPCLPARQFHVGGPSAPPCCLNARRGFPDPDPAR
eukprot:616011-Pyramimonas_sp.AAC.1